MLSPSLTTKYNSSPLAMSISIIRVSKTWKAKKPVQTVCFLHSIRDWHLSLHLSRLWNLL